MPASTFVVVACREIASASTDDFAVAND